MALIDNLVSYWKMDEVSGNRADSHASNTLTDTNTVASATGKIDLGADFEKTNSEVLTITDASQTGLDITGAFSFNCWLTLESSTGSNNTIVSKYTVANGKGYEIYIGTANWIQGNFTAADGSSSTGATNNSVIPDDGTFRMVTVTFTPSGSDRVKIYLNAAVQSIPSPTDSAWDIAATADPFCIGSRNGSAFYDGIIDECGIWDKVLTQSEIDQLYNGGAGLAYPLTTTAIKTLGGLAIGSVKTVGGLAIASVKTIGGLA
ncbi:MAG: LamG domain-containing protein [Alphaproteobacteria bacterium]|nr:LamG domain-containing protein [Alphaproteobacteria bacterium]